MRKPAFCTCENIDADHDQHLYFCCIGSPISLLPKSEISSLWPSFVNVQPSLCQTWSETLETGFLATQFIYSELSVLYHLHVCPKHDDRKKQG